MTKSAVALFVLLIGISVSVVAQTGTVVFKVSNVQMNKGGEITAGIFTKPNFPKVGKQLKSVEKGVNASYLEVTMNQVPTGTYGAVVFQDVNKNRELETNFMGFPKEPIGFANGAEIRLGPPAFEDASIQVKENEVTVVRITLD